MGTRAAMPAIVGRIVERLQYSIEKIDLFHGRVLHAQILTSGLATDIFLNNKLIEFYAGCGLVKVARRVFDAMPARNSYSWNGMIGSYSKAGLCDDAYQLLAEMPERNVVSWNTVISALVKGNAERKALDLYGEMVLGGFMPSHFTFASVLSACGALGDAEVGRRCHGLVVKVGLDGNVYVGNGLVGMYAKCGNMRDAVGVFEIMVQPNEVTCTSLMTGFANSDDFFGAFRMFLKMHERGIRIDQVALSSVISVCARCGGIVSELYLNSSHFGKFHGEQVHAIATKLGCDQDVHVSNSLTDMYVKCGDVFSAEKNFEMSSKINVVSWNVLIAGYGQHGLGCKAVELWKTMQRLGFEPDDVTYVSLLSACVKSGDVETAREMFDKLSNRNVPSWNAMLSGYNQKGWHKDAIEIFQDMQSRCVPYDRTTLAVVLSSCAADGFLEYGKQVHAASIRTLLHLDVFVASGLVDMYSKCGNMNAAKVIFDRMEERDVVVWNSMMGCLALHSQNQETFTFFKLMKSEGISPTQFSYASLVSYCARLSNLSQGRQVHGQVLRDGYIYDVFVGSTLIDMYGKSGNMDDAQRIFDCAPYKNVITWNEMIHGYAQNGFAKEAIDLFEKMIDDGGKPDSVTYIAVLTACNHSGLVESAIKYFNMMENDHDIQPVADHYTCLIDSLGRASRFEEAETVVDKMPCKDEPIIWEVLLSCCRIYGNVKLGKRAAEELFRLDPENPAPYVLLSNIYASVGRWDDVIFVRKMMGDRKVIKDRAYSWTDSRKGVQAFMVDDDFGRAYQQDKIDYNPGEHLAHML